LGSLSFHRGQRQVLSVSSQIEQRCVGIGSGNFRGHANKEQPISAGARRLRCGEPGLSRVMSHFNETRPRADIQHTVKPTPFAISDAPRPTSLRVSGRCLSKPGGPCIRQPRRPWRSPRVTEGAPRRQGAGVLSMAAFPTRRPSGASNSLLPKQNQPHVAHKISDQISKRRHLVLP
jgi:hypothetical protein